MQRGQVKPPEASLASEPMKACPETPSALRCGNPILTCEAKNTTWRSASAQRLALRA